MRRSSNLLAAAILLGGALGPRAAEAHAFGIHYDLPLPLWMYMAAAGATVAVSAVVVAWRGDRPRREGHRRIGLADFAFTRAVLALPVLIALRILSAALFVFLIAAGLFGRQDDPLVNILPTAVWVIWWVGFAYLNAFVGDIWRAVNPWEIIARWAGGLGQKLDIAIGAAHRRKPPAWLDAWPAVALFMAFGWAELCWPQNVVPALLAGAILLYSVVTWVGMARYGIDGWLRTGEVFAVFFGILGRFAPIEPSSLTLRPYGVGLLQRSGVSTSMLAFVILALAMVSFDGFSETPLWAGLNGAALAALYRAGFLVPVGYAAGAAIVKTVGLVAAPLVFLSIYLAVCRLSGRLLATVGVEWGTLAIARRFVLTLVPIAIAYHLAHYLSYFLIYGQQVVPLASDPLGRGWNLFGTAGYRMDIGIVGARFIWFTSVGAIVVGHIAAIWLAHLTALRTFGDRAIALRSQVPMVALMVGYTMLSLWIISQPIIAA